MVVPGDRVKMIIELVALVACEEGMRFAIREGGKTVGAGERIHVGQFKAPFENQINLI